MTSITLPGLGIVVINPAVLIGLEIGFFSNCGHQAIIGIYPRPTPPHHSFKLVHCCADGFEFQFYASEFDLDFDLSCLFVACD